MALLEVKDLSVLLHTHRGSAAGVRQVSFALERGQTLGVIANPAAARRCACWR